MKIINSRTLDSLEIDKICRTCLDPDPNLKSMFRDGEILGERIKLADVLTQFSSLEISEDDQLPQHMCTRCVLILSRSYMFLKNCLKADETLRKIVFPEKIKIPSPEFCIVENEDNTLYFYEQPNARERIFQNFVSTTTEDKYQLADVHMNTVQVHNKEQEHCIEEEDSSIQSSMIVQKFSSQKSQVQIDKITHAFFSDNVNKHQVTNSKDLNIKPATTTTVKVYRIENPTVECSKLGSFEHSDENFEESDVEHSLIQVENEYISNNSNDGGEIEEEEELEEVELNEAEPNEEIDLMFDRCSSTAENQYHDVDGKHSQTGGRSDNFKIQKVKDEQDNLVSYEIELKNKKNKKFVCSICKKALATQNSYKYHMQLHSNEAKYQCNVCGESFKTRNSYTGHSITHDINNPHTCHLCKKSYRQASSLRGHIETIHKGRKPFSCSECPKSFTQRSGYKKHLLIHSGEKPYTCSICFKKLRYKSNLIAHKRAHSKNQSHQRVRSGEGQTE